VLLRLFLILRSYKPLTFFGGCSLDWWAWAGGRRPASLRIPYRALCLCRPSAILAASLILLAFLSLGLGLILNSTNLRLLELEKLLRKRPARRSDAEPKQ